MCGCMYIVYGFHRSISTRLTCYKEFLVEINFLIRDKRSNLFLKLCFNFPRDSPQMISYIFYFSRLFSSSMNGTFFLYIFLLFDFYFFASFFPEIIIYLMWFIDLLLVFINTVNVAYNDAGNSD